VAARDALEENIVLRVCLDVVAELFVDVDEGDAVEDASEAICVSLVCLCDRLCVCVIACVS
jgi:hypothetical protein